MAKIKKQAEILSSKANGAAKGISKKFKNKKKTLDTTPNVQNENIVESISISEFKLNEKVSKKKNKKVLVEPKIESETNVAAVKESKKKKSVDVPDATETESHIKVLKKKFKTENIGKAVLSVPKEKKKAKKLANQKVEVDQPEPIVKSEKKVKKSKTTDSSNKTNGNSSTRTAEEIKAARNEKRKLRKKKRLAELKTVTTVKDKSSFSVFVGNLPVNTKRDKVFKLFSKFGQITSIRFRLSNGVKFFKSKSKVTTPNVIAFVDFANEEDAKSSLVLNGEKFKDNVIRVNLQSSVKTADNFDAKRTVFVGNLKYSVTDQSLHDFFSCCGDIEYTRTLQCEKGCSGSGYVCFKKPESVGMALELNDTDLLGRPARVQRYVKKDKFVVGKKKQKVTGGARRIEQKIKKEKNNDGKVKSPKKEFTGIKSTDKKKNLKKKKKILKGPKLLAKKIAHREKVAESP